MAKERARKPKVRRSITREQFARAYVAAWRHEIRHSDHAMTAHAIERRLNRDRKAGKALAMGFEEFDRYVALLEQLAPALKLKSKRGGVHRYSARARR